MNCRDGFAALLSHISDFDKSLALPSFFAFHRGKKILQFWKFRMTTATEHHYVATDDEILSAEPIIGGTGTPVRAIVEIYRLGASEETPNRLPHLTVAQVFDALSYYNDHPHEINLYIEQNRTPDDLIDPLVAS